MKVTRFTHMLMALTVTLSAWAQGPNGSGTYYQNANALKGEALKTALSKIISTDAKDLGYDALWNAYKTTEQFGTSARMSPNTTLLMAIKAIISKRATCLIESIPHLKVGLRKLVR